ncbi:hypothetical protein V6Z12_A11G251900 [Gossypium hirsutum]
METFQLQPVTGRYLQRSSTSRSLVRIKGYRSRSV